MTAAHRSLPFGTRLRVVNETNGRSVVVRVNDRGPFAHRRIIDLAKGPAQQLGLTSAGTAFVSLHRLD
jgi:rare lipoprotein A